MSWKCLKREWNDRLLLQIVASKSDQLKVAFPKDHLHGII